MRILSMTSSRGGAVGRCPPRASPRAASRRSRTELLEARRVAASSARDRGTDAAGTSRSCGARLAQTRTNPRSTGLAIDAPRGSGSCRSRPRRATRRNWPRPAWTSSRRRSTSSSSSSRPIEQRTADRTDLGHPWVRSVGRCRRVSSVVRPMTPHPGRHRSATESTGDRDTGQATDVARAATIGPATFR